MRGKALRKELDVQNRQKKIKKRYNVFLKTKLKQKLSTFKKPEKRAKVIYTPGYTHYPQDFGRKKRGELRNVCFVKFS